MWGSQGMIVDARGAELTFFVTDYLPGFLHNVAVKKKTYSGRIRCYGFCCKFCSVCVNVFGLLHTLGCFSSSKRPLLPQIGVINGDTINLSWQPVLAALMMTWL